MTEDRIVRRALWMTTAANIGAAPLFAFPASLGWIAGLPAEVPTVYAMMLALFVLLFGGAYGWLALQPTIDRPLLALGAIGKTGAFTVVFLCWCAGAADFGSVLAITGDLGFAAVFFWWLLRTRSAAAA